jgi:hypothetical protein
MLRKPKNGTISLYLNDISQNRFNTVLIKMSATRQARRDPEVDKIRSIFWFHWIGMQIDSTQANDVRKVLEPNQDFLNKDGQPDKNAKFSQYKHGERMPNATLIEQAERIIPGSRSVIDHPLWRVLRHQGDTTDIAAQWVAKLSPKVQNLMVKSDRTIRYQATEIYLRELGKLATWDSLAGLTVVLRMNIDAENHEGTWKCTHAIFGLLVVLSTQLIAYGIAADLYGVFANRFFLSARNGGHRRAWMAHPFERMAILAQIWAEREKAVVTGGRRTTLYYINAAIEGKIWTEDHDFMPTMIPDLDIGPPTERGMQMLKQYLSTARRRGIEIDLGSNSQ